MEPLPLCGPVDGLSDLVPPGPSYMTPDPAYAGEGRAFAVEASLAALSHASATAYDAQLQLDDLTEVLDRPYAGIDPALGDARAACMAARRSLRVALLAVAGLHDRLVPPRGRPKPPPAS